MHFNPKIIPKDHTSGNIHRFQCEPCNECYYGENVRHLRMQ